MRSKNKLLKKKPNWEKIIYWFVLGSMALASVGVILIMIFAPSSPKIAEPFERVKSEYVLMLLQCLLGIFAMFLPSILKNKLRLVIPSKMIIVYAVFLYCAIFLGEVRKFYYTVPHWDTILHTSSGAMLGALGFSFINLLNKTDRVPVNLSPIFIAVFTFCFAVSLGVIWEIYEFSADCILGTNMQKFMTESGEMLIGQKALADTMKDLIVDCIGAFVISAIGFVSLKYQKGWVEKMQISVSKK